VRIPDSIREMVDLEVRNYCSIPISQLSTVAVNSDP